MTAALQSSVFLQSAIIFGLASKPQILPVVKDLIVNARAQDFVATLTLLRDFARTHLSILANNLHYIQWIGASLDTNTRTSLSKVAEICPAMGTSGYGPYFLATPDDTKDWQYYISSLGRASSSLSRR